MSSLISEYFRVVLKRMFIREKCLLISTMKTANGIALSALLLLNLSYTDSLEARTSSRASSPPVRASGPSHHRAMPSRPSYRAAPQGNNVQRGITGYQRKAEPKSTYGSQKPKHHDSKGHDNPYFKKAKQEPRKQVYDSGRRHHREEKRYEDHHGFKPKYHHDKKREDIVKRFHDYRDQKHPHDYWRGHKRNHHKKYDSSRRPIYIEVPAQPSFSGSSFSGGSTFNYFNSFPSYREADREPEPRETEPLESRVEDKDRRRQSKVEEDCYRLECPVWADISTNDRTLDLYVKGAIYVSWPISIDTDDKHIVTGSVDYDGQPTRLAIINDARKGISNMHVVFIDRTAIYGAPEGIEERLKGKIPHGSIGLEPDHAKTLYGLVQKYGPNDSWITVGAEKSRSLERPAASR